MNEHLLQLIASLKIVWLAVFSYLYGEGGIDGKWKRRFIGSAWMMLGVFAFSMWQGLWHNWYLLFLPIAMGGLSNGYGADSVMGKVSRRALYGLILSLAGLPLVVFSHLWFLFGFSIGLAVLSSVLLGTWNPCKSARDEESLIATLCFLLMLYLI